MGGQSLGDMFPIKSPFYLTLSRHIILWFTVYAIKKSDIYNYLKQTLNITNVFKTGYSEINRKNVIMICTHIVLMVLRIRTN